MAVTRRCGDCQLCCRLLPVRPLQKGAGQSCQYQKFHKGCTVYRTAAMPPECSLWNCRWLVDDAADLARPDRSHVVIDIMPDFITIREGETDQPRHIQVDQYWIDPRHRDAHRDPSLRRFMFRRAQDGIAALIRFNERDALTVFAPPFDINGQWHEIAGGAREQTHSLPEIVKALSG